MALELPIPSFPAGGSGSGTVLFDLSASISITAAQFQAGMNQVSAKISAVNDSLTSVISAIGNLETKLNGITSSDANGVSSVKNAVENLASSASTADANVGSLQSAVGDADDAMDGLHDATTQADSALVVIGDTIMTGGSKWENFTSKLSSAWNKLKSFGSVAWDIGSQLVSAAANFENIDYVFSQVLAENAEQAEAQVQYYADMYNIHEAILKRSITSINQQLKSAGLDSNVAFAKSVEVMNLAAIAASAYGTSVDDATDRLLSFMRGNVEAGEKIGLFTNQLARDSIAQELYQKNWKELSETQRQLALLKIASRTYEPYENVPKDRSSSYGRVVENLKYQWEEIQATLGQPILDTVTPILENLSKWLKENPDAVKNLASAIGAIVQGIADLFKNLANYIDEHPEILALLKWAISKVPTVVTSLLESSVPGSPFMTEAEYHKYVESEYESTDTPVTATDMEKYDALKAYVNTVDYYQDMNPFKRIFYMSEMDDAEAAAKEHLGKFFTTDEIKKIIAYVNETGIYEDDSIWRSNETNQMPVEFIKWVKETLDINPETPHGIQYFSQLPENISQAIVAALPSALSGIGVYMDSTLVGNLVTPTVTSNMARSSRGKKFTNGTIG